MNRYDYKIQSDLVKLCKSKDEQIRQLQNALKRQKYAMKEICRNNVKNAYWAYHNLVDAKMMLEKIIDRNALGQFTHFSAKNSVK